VQLSGREARFLAENEGVMGALLDEASARAGSDLRQPLRDGDILSLDDRRQQLLTYAFSVGMARAVEAVAGRPGAVAGYSFGIYAALCVSGAVSFSDGISVLEKARDLMEEHSAGRGCGMGVVVGLSPEEVEEIVASDAGTARIVNSNNPTCKVLSGPLEDLRRVLAEAARRDAVSAGLLPLEVPYHHPEILGGTERPFREFLRCVEWRDASCPVVSSIDRRLLSRAGDLADFTARNLSTPMDWERVVGVFHELGLARVVECGPGVSLTQNARFAPFEIAFSNVRNVGRWLDGLAGKR